MKGDNF